MPAQSLAEHVLPNPRDEPRVRAGACRRRHLIASLSSDSYVQAAAHHRLACRRQVRRKPGQVCVAAARDYDLDLFCGAHDLSLLSCAMVDLRARCLSVPGLFIRPHQCFSAFPSKTR